MPTPAKRNSVTYDANRIRVPPEPHVSRPHNPSLHPQKTGLRVVSDDLVQRQTRPSHLKTPRLDSSPDGFVFLGPLRDSGRKSAVFGQDSPILHLTLASLLHSASNLELDVPVVTNPTGGSSLSLSVPLSVPNTAPYGHHLLSRSVSRVKAQFTAAKRHSSCPGTSLASPALRSASARASPVQIAPETAEISGKIVLQLPPQAVLASAIPHLFSFSAANESVIAVSPARTSTASFTGENVPLDTEKTAESGPESGSVIGFVNETSSVPGGHGETVPPLSPPPIPYLGAPASGENEGLTLPPKSLASLLGSNPIDHILGVYEHSVSLVALGELRVAPETKTHPLLTTPAFQNSNGPYQPKHDRQDSQSSAISLASSSTLTSAHTQQQRFVRYVMSTQNNMAHTPGRWGMEAVLSWLDTHGFPETWKSTFRRNEISGNRFLELANYDAASAVWRQLSQTLGSAGTPELVDRFIVLLLQTLNLEAASTPSPFNAFLDIEPYSKLENRKSSSSLWTQSTPSVTTKQRPFSYIDLGTQKPVKEHGKFFRKHARLSSNDSNKDLLTQSPSSTQLGKSHGEASLGLSNLGFKKSGILSTLRKYGGEKAAGIVKQVQSGPTSGKQFSHKRMGSGLLNVLHKKTESGPSKPTVPEFAARNSQTSVLTDPEESLRSPNSVRSFNVLPPDDNSSANGAIASLKLVRRPSLEDLFDHEFLPLPQSIGEDVVATILLTRDNHSFIPFPLEAKLLGNFDALRSKFIQKLDMLDIGTITYHLTDFHSQSGAAIPEDLLVSALLQGLVSKLKLEQNFRSPERIGTFSSTSSDSKSFDTSGGKMYPETPQYLLQHSNDKAMDYMNFKDMTNKAARKPSRDFDLPALPLFGSLERVPSGAYPINLSMPQLKRLQQANAAIPNLNKRGLPLINTSHSVISSEQDSRDPLNKLTPSPSSFTIVRREGREIDFDKRRLNPTENKAPRLIPNIYSSSVTDAAISPITASTIHALKEEKASSPVTSNSRSGTRSTRALSSALDLEKGASFVARRKAPPPPTASNSLKVTNKKSIGNLSVLSGSNRSDFYHLSNDSIDSFRSSQAGGSTLNVGAKTFDFSDAPSLELPTHIGGITDDADDDDVFFKPLQASGPKMPEKAAPVSNKNSLSAANMAINDLVSEQDKMEMRPSVDEVYDNLERYFPNTILDKPIIDAYPDSPSIAPIPDVNLSKPTLRKPPISRTFSNANISPVHPEKESDDQVFYGDGPRLRRRMKTIRAVAHEAHKKRLASQKAVKEPIRKHTPQTDRGSLARANTKLWGQKVVEVTSDDIEKGIVGRIRKIANTSCEEFAWVKGELIGRGSFGSVFLALNVTTGEMLAVKQVNVNESSKSNSDGIDAFHKEVETMKDLDHLNIVQYLGFEQSKQTYSLFLEYVAGGSISSCLKTYGKFDEPLVKFITRQVLEGLKYLHENGILHRDLKADNLLLEIDGVCKISDFGISKRSQDIYSNNAEMSMQGTVFWMAPEVIHSMVEEKKQGYSAKVDIWSLGCVMLEMFAGQRPWSNEAVVSAIYKLGKTKLAPPIPADVSQEAKDFLNKCFTIDSEKRPTAAELLDHEFVRPDGNFKFCETRLSEIIKSNPSKKMAKR